MNYSVVVGRLFDGLNIAGLNKVVGIQVKQVAALSNAVCEIFSPRTVPDWTPLKTQLALGNGIAKVLPHPLV